MVTLLLAFSLFVAPFQDSQDLKVGSIFVNSPYNNGIIFAYAHASIPEDEPLREGALECFVSELKATRLFTDVRVELKPIEDGRKVNVTIMPTWYPRIESFLIDEIVFESFEGIDEERLHWVLRQKGLSLGTPLMQYPLGKILQMVEYAAHEIYQGDPQMEERVNEMFLQPFSFRVKVVAPERVKLTIISGHRALCQ
jgi:hypothetical protein